MDTKPIGKDTWEAETPAKCGPTSENVFKCLKCSEIFPSSDLLLSHCLRHERGYKCDVCSTKFNTYAQYLVHKRLVHTPQRFDHVCEVCGDILKLKQDLYSHFRTHCLTKGVVKCSKCKMPFKNLVFLKLHELSTCSGYNSYSVKNNISDKEMMNEDTSVEICEQEESVCKETIDVPGDKLRCLRKRKRKITDRSEEDEEEDDIPCDLEIESGCLTHLCPYCPMTFYTKGLYTVHIQTHLKPHICDICNRGFGKRYTMECHRKTHSSIKDHVCGLCCASFTLAAQLNKHQTKYHGPNAKFACSVCQGRFHIKVAMLSHEELCSLASSLEESNSRNLNGDADLHKVMKSSQCRMKFSCHVCHKEFNNYLGLKRHSRCHQFKYSCKFCEYKYDSKYVIVNHVMAHLDIKPYRCTACGSSFTSKSHCERHCNIHLKNQYYHCSICKLGFRFDPEKRKHELEFCVGLLPKQPKLKNLWVLDDYNEQEVMSNIITLSSKMPEAPDVVSIKQEKVDEDVNEGNEMKRVLRSRVRKDVGCLNDGVNNNTSGNNQDACKKVKENNQSEDYDTRINRGDLGCKSSSNDVDVTRAELNNSSNNETHQTDAEDTNTNKKKSYRKCHFPCSVCGKVFKRKPLLEYHEVKEHSIGREPYKCCLCGYGAAFKSRMNKHIESHLLRKFLRCKGCGVRFVSQRSLASHLAVRQCYKPDKDKETDDDPQEFEGNIEFSNFDGVFSQEDQGFVEDGNINTNTEVKIADNTFGTAASLSDTSEDMMEDDIIIKEEIVSSDIETDLSSYMSMSKSQDEGSPLKWKTTTTTTTKRQESADKQGNEGKNANKLTVMPLTVQIITDSQGNERIKVNGIPLQRWKTFILDSSKSRNKKKQVTGFSGWCHICKKKIPGKYKYRVHMERHGEERPYECPTCGKTFKTDENLRGHMRWHDEKKIKACEICSSKFVTPGDLAEHAGLHKNLKPFPCPTCGKEFRRKIYLESHKRTHTGEMPFQCKICERRFRVYTSLNDHMKMHEGSFPFQCSVCSKKFTQRANWRTHERRHQGQKKYECEVCQKGFVQNYELQNHRLRCVEKDLPFICLLCGMRFVKEHPLKRHLSRHNCGVCGEQFVNMKEKVSHQLRCRKAAAKRKKQNKTDVIDSMKKIDADRDDTIFQKIENDDEIGDDVSEVSAIYEADGNDELTEIFAGADADSDSCNLIIIKTEEF